MARRPAFAPEEIERQRQQMLSALQVSFEDPEYIADAVFDRLVYGFHPYGMPQTRHARDARRRSRATISSRSTSATSCPNNAILADRRRRDGRRSVRRRQEGLRRLGSARDVPRRRVHRAARSDAARRSSSTSRTPCRPRCASATSASRAIIPTTWRSTWRSAFSAARASNRLHQVLRTERGLTYGAQADMDALKESGDFEAATNTRSDATGEVLRLMVDEFWRLQRERVGERELADAKAYMTGSFPLTIETPDAIATQVLNVLFYGLPVEELQTFRERVNAVTVDDIERVARFYSGPTGCRSCWSATRRRSPRSCEALGFGTVRDGRRWTNLDLTPSTSSRPGRSAGGAGQAAAGRRRRRPADRPAGSVLRVPAAAIAAGRRRGGPSAQGAARPRDRREGRPRDAARRQDASSP